MEFGVARCSFWASRPGRSTHPHTDRQQIEGRIVVGEDRKDKKDAERKRRGGKKDATTETNPTE